MRVKKRNGSLEEVKFDRITERIQPFCNDLDKSIDPTSVSQKICSRIHDKIPTSELDELTCEICISLSITHPDYGKLASRIIVDNHHKNTLGFSETIEILYNNKDLLGELHPLVSDDVLKISKKYEKEIDDIIDYQRDYNLDYFGFKTLYKAYLLKVDKKVVERPQHMWMRVSIGIHSDNLEKIKETYNLMSQGYFTHATPTLFHAGTPRPQLSSCFLLGTEDSVEGIFKSITDCAKISKWAGGIGLHISNIRCRGAYIRKTSGISTGILPMLKVYNDTARYINQCFTPKTIIYTQRGAVPIEFIEKYDMVITGTGEFKPVLKIFKNTKDEEILRIKTVNSNDFVEVTKVHQIFRIKNNSTNLLNNIENEKGEYVSALELQKGDIVCFPIPKYGEKDIVEYDNNLCRFYGILLGNGHLNQNKTGGNIVFGIEQNDTINFVKTFLENNNINYQEKIETNFVLISWKEKFNIKHADMFDYKFNRKISEDFLKCSDENCLNIIKGLVETIGMINEEITFDLPNKNLINNIRFLLLRLGILSSGYTEYKTYDSKKISIKQSFYILKIPRHPKLASVLNITPSENLDFLEFKNNLYSRIQSIDEIHHTGDVYDLNIQDNHNYLTQMGLVHNSGRRPGSIALYLEPWHFDIFDFLDAKKNTGSEEERARDLFYALWIPDLFMKRVENDEDWCLMCPDSSPGLKDVHSEEFEKLYTNYEKQGKFIKKIPARKVWEAIISSQIETGTPYILFKDAANKKSNQQNLGTICSSNLCTEIIEYSDKNEYAVCNLSSIALPKFLKEQEVDWKGKDILVYGLTDCIFCKLTKKLLDKNGIKYVEILLDDEEKRKELFQHLSDKFQKTIKTVPQVVIDDELIGGYTNIWDKLKPIFDHEKLFEITKIITYNLNRVIDINFYPVPETKNSNMRHRPIGIGIQGLADLFAMLRLSFDSEEAATLNREIFETIYFASLTESHRLAKQDGSYSSFKGSPLSKGLFQFDLWDKYSDEKTILSGRWDWDDIRKKIIKDGTRNSLLVAPMPTASTSQILNNNECFEPYTYNLYTRRTIAGEFLIINKHLLKELMDLGIWNDEIRDKLMYFKGSIKKIQEIPNYFREIYKTSWELKQKIIIDLAVDRGRFVCQSQSLNIFLDNPSYKVLTSVLFYGWKKGLKTGTYYIRSRAAINSQNFTIDPDKEKRFEDPDCKFCDG